MISQSVGIKSSTADLRLIVFIRNVSEMSEPAAPLRQNCETVSQDEHSPPPHPMMCADLSLDPRFLSKSDDE